MSELEIETSNSYDRLIDPTNRTFQVCDILSKSRFKIPIGLLSISYVNNIKIREIHTRFLNKANITDVITFPGNPQLKFSGEIIISAERAMKQYSIYKTTFSQELTLYLVHGWLHLAGFNDRNTSEIKEMRKAENEALNLISENSDIDEFRLSII